MHNKQPRPRKLLLQSFFCHLHNFPTLWFGPASLFGGGSWHNITIGNFVGSPMKIHGFSASGRGFCGISNFGDGHSHTMGDRRLCLAFNHLDEMLQFVDIPLWVPWRKRPIHGSPRIKNLDFDLHLMYKELRTGKCPCWCNELKN